MKESIKEYILDFSNIDYYSEVHKEIKKGLDFPDYYGENWDAFWDLLSEMVCCDTAFHIRVIGMERLELAFPKAAKTMIDIFRRAKHYGDDRFAHKVFIEVMTEKNKYEII